jgi:lipoprotein-releasing system permease protein
MRFEVRVALRHLTSSRLQTGLILSLVAVGVLVFTFIASLINGLADVITEDIIGGLPHIYLEVPDPDPQLLPGVAGDDGREVLLARERGEEARRAIEGWRPMIARLEAEPGVRAVQPVARGNGLIRRGPRAEPVALAGVPPDRLSIIVDVAGNLVDGDDRLGPDDLILGITLARNLGVEAGQRVTVISERDAVRAFTVRGIFETGGPVDDGTVFLDIAAAQSLLDLTGRVTRIEIQLIEVFDAPDVARRVAAETGLWATDWIEETPQLEQALSAQANTGDMVKAFSMLIVVIGVTSALFLAATRRRSEVGIMRSMGISKGAVTRIFVLQGTVIGLAGSVLGCAAGWLFGSLFVELTVGPDGRAALPLDPAQGEYLSALLIATVACTVAAILPARSAAAVDPVEVIQQ